MTRPNEISPLHMARMYVPIPSLAALKAVLSVYEQLQTQLPPCSAQQRIDAITKMRPTNNTTPRAFHTAFPAAPAPVLATFRGTSAPPAGRVVPEQDSYDHRDHSYACGHVLSV